MSYQRLIQWLYHLFHTSQAVGRLEQLCHLPEKIYPQGGTSWNPVILRSSQSQGGLLASIYCVGVELFHCNQLTNQYLLQIVVLHSSEDVAYVAFVCHPCTQTPSMSRVPSSTTHKRESVILCHFPYISSGDASRETLATFSGYSVICRVGSARQWLTIIIKGQYCIDQLSRRYGSTEPLEWHSRISITPKRTQLEFRSSSKLTASSITRQHLRRHRKYSFCMCLTSFQLALCVALPALTLLPRYSRLLGCYSRRCKADSAECGPVSHLLKSTVWS